MNCPACSKPLQMTERQGVEIDYCPQCRGVWLDRGELDKIIERSAQVRRDDDDDDDRRRYPAPGPSGGGYHHSGGSYQKPYKKKSLLGEIFDF